MCRNSNAPRSEALGAGQSGRAGDAGSAAVSTSNYTTAASHWIPPSPCPRLVTWLRCRTCHAGYFAASAPGPQACPACTGGRLQPVALWDLRTDASPPGMLRLTIDALVRGEVQV